MGNILEQLNRGMKMQSRSVILFMDYATVYSESLIGIVFFKTRLHACSRWMLA